MAHLKNEDSGLTGILQASFGEDKDPLRALLQHTIQQVLGEEMTAFLEAEPYRRTENLREYRNGYKPRTLKTRVGRRDLLVPKDSEGLFQTELFEKYRRNEKALVLAVTEMCVQGVSTRKVRKITEELCGLDLSKSQVSALAKGLDAEVTKWWWRPLEKRYPYLMDDALYEKVRRQGAVVSRGVLIVVCIDEDGHREVLGVWCADTEREASWSAVFREQKERVLRKDYLYNPFRNSTERWLNSKTSTFILKKKEMDIMDCTKVGKLIWGLRKEKKITQKQLADAMSISDKTISKWECGRGCPDVSLLQKLSEVLSVNIEKILLGDLDPNNADGGNMKKIKFYSCLTCGNIITSTGAAEVSCCGRKLTALIAKPSDDAHHLNIENVEYDYFITFSHEMSKAHYVNFIAYVACDRVLFVKLYPEQGGEVRFPRLYGGKLYFGCNQHGLWVNEE